MKNTTLLKISFLSLTLTSCGYLEKWKTPTEATDSVEISRSSSSEDMEDFESLGVEDFVDSNSFAENETTEDFSDIDNFVVQAQELEVVPQINEKITQSEKTNFEAGTISHYTVKKDETLMQISFKIYGDIAKWKEIKKLNPNISSKALSAGSKIKYVTPDTEFSWSPVGTPYLIKSGDTLGIISNQFYSTPTKWKAIWENNKPLIKDPNKIYAGFTVYAKTGEMASQVHPDQGMKLPTKSKLEVEELTLNEMIDEDKLIDETFQKLSATQRVLIENIVSEAQDIEYLD